MPSRFPPHSVLEILHSQACAIPERIAIRTTDGMCMTFEGWARAANEYSRSLTEAGIRSGDQALLLTGGHSNWIGDSIAYMGMIGSGVIPILSAGKLPPALMPKVAPPCGPWDQKTVESMPLLEAVQSEGRQRPPLAPDRPLDLVYSSASTGVPRPTLSRHSDWLPRRTYAPRFPRICAHAGIPFGSSTGVHGVMLAHLARGVTSLCITRVDSMLTEELRDVSELDLTPMAAVELCDSGLDPVESVRVVKVKAGPLSPSVAQCLQAVFPASALTSVYGLTEAGAAVLVSRYDPQRPLSIGRSTASCEVRITNDGHPEPRPGAMGEIELRWRATDGRNGPWIPTGDLGEFDSEGYVHLSARQADLIILPNGARLGSRDLEHQLASLLRSRNESPLGVHVVGMTKSKHSAVVIALPASLDRESAWWAVTRLQLANSLPELVVISCREIPRSPAGKLDRRALLGCLSEVQPRSAITWLELR
jgi:fatty-acyl-CoA synthase